MKLYVWDGPNVLQNYNSGIVVVAANSADEAWNKLKKNNFNVYYALRTGNGWIGYGTEEEFVSSNSLEEQEEYFKIDNFNIGLYPLEPDEYNIEDLPNLYRWGGE